MRQLMRAAILALTLVFSAGALAVCIEVSDSSRSELLTPSASEALENCLAPSVRADDESGTWRFIQVQRGGRGGGGYRGGYSAYRPPPSSSMSRSFNRAAAPRPPVVRPPAARPPIARAPTVRLGPSVSRIGPRPFARSVATRGPVMSSPPRGIRGPTVGARASSRVIARAQPNRSTVRSGVSRPQTMSLARVATPRAIASRSSARNATVARVGGAIRAQGRPANDNARLARSGATGSQSLSRRSSSLANVAQSSTIARGASPRGFAFATGSTTLVVRSNARMAGASGAATAASLRQVPAFRVAEAALKRRVDNLQPANSRIAASWGVNTYRHGGLMTTMEHINYRHGPKSGFSNVSRFSKDTSVRQVKQYVDAALAGGSIRRNGSNSFSIEYNFGRPIGTNSAGQPASGIRVHVRNGIIQTAFPI
jgi:hypothetical protein